LSDLAFGIFRSNFLKANNIAQLSEQVAKDIRMSYIGGVCNMYIPNNIEEKVIYAYDVKYLYPYVMKEFDMSTGNPVYFQGDIRAIEKNAFGFFFCNIIAPENLNHPILQTHVKISNGIRTVAPLGQ
jgi:DNA polymerase type B, organellar and viral